MSKAKLYQSTTETTIFTCFPSNGRILNSNGNSVIPALHVPPGATSIFKLAMNSSTRRLKNKCMTM